MSCTKCGLKIIEDAIYCFKCGNKVDNTIEELKADLSAIAKKLTEAQNTDADNIAKIIIQDFFATANKAHSLCNNCPFDNECNFDCIVVQLDEKVWQLYSLFTEDEFEELKQAAENEEIPT